MIKFHFSPCRDSNAGPFALKSETIYLLGGAVSNWELELTVVCADSSDIVDQKIKLIMGLIWTLILHYSISMPMWEDEDPAASKDQTPKQRLLDWIRSKIPEKNITNFTSDWNDGTAIAALVDAIGPGTSRIPLTVI